MSKFRFLKAALAGSTALVALASAAYAENFNIPAGDLKVALDAYARQTGVQLVMSSTAVRGAHTRGVHGDLSASVALTRILDDTNFVSINTSPNAYAVVHEDAASASRTEQAAPVYMADASARAASGVETVVVTSSKIKGDIQTVPIAITALSQEQLTSRQIAGGPDLVKEVPNLTFSKTNFSGYNIQIRGIGTQAISVTTDPAVAVAFNDIPFIRNHFFEQEFYDVNQVEVLRGPQGTLYGRNATAGVVNVISAKPTDQFEAMLSVDWGNYTNRRYEGMVNIPIVDDRLDLRVAGEWTKRNGYTLQLIARHNRRWPRSVVGPSQPSVGSRFESVQIYAVWEHFQENDDRMRCAKQLVQKGSGADIGGWTGYCRRSGARPRTRNSTRSSRKSWLSQGCLPTSLYSKDAFETPNGQVIPFVALGEFYIGVGERQHRRSSLNPLIPTRTRRNPRNLRDHPVADQAGLPREERYAGTQRRLGGNTGADADLADRLQQGFPFFH